MSISGGISLFFTLAAVGWSMIPTGMMVMAPLGLLSVDHFLERIAVGRWSFTPSFFFLLATTVAGVLLILLLGLPLGLRRTRGLGLRLGLLGRLARREIGLKIPFELGYFGL